MPRQRAADQTVGPPAQERLPLAPGRIGTFIAVSGARGGFTGGGLRGRGGRGRVGGGAKVRSDHRAVGATGSGAL
ncbi:MAG: hypothetical protein AMXMBFR23_28680 [Chloroflexota bacterium]